jgi:hypothetical protein
MVVGFRVEFTAIPVHTDDRGQQAIAVVLHELIGFKDLCEGPLCHLFHFLYGCDHPSILPYITTIGLAVEIFKSDP